MHRDKAIPMVYGALVFLLSACATAANGASSDEPRGIERYAGDPRLGEEVSNMCFASSVDSFSENTDDTVVLAISPKKSYLVEVDRGCYNLDTAQSIGLAASMSCASKGDKLIVSDSAFGLGQSSGIGPSSCLIKGIYEWDKDALKMDEAQ
ncbi:DUF6491 family protein [Ponticaulis profundi]|uniref:DUF6491 family protein n=1 Tax=Ponticaulis profundi TaxID=2665222 RepID=A0ABW1SEV0_9PROT